MKRHVDRVPSSRYMSVQMGQLAVADVREIFPGDFVKHSSHIGVHMSPMQAPELSPMFIRQDSYFCPNRILWDFWDNYISQKLLENSAVGPFDENKLLPPQIAIALGAGYNKSDSKSRHMPDVRGVYDLLEGLKMKFAFTDSVSPGTTDDTTYTGSVLMFNAFPLMGYYRIWHDFYRDAFLHNDKFVASTTNRIPEYGDPWADEQPQPDGTPQAFNDWSAHIGLISNFAGKVGNTLPGYKLMGDDTGALLHGAHRGIFTFAKRHPAMSIGLDGGTVAKSVVFPGACCFIPLDNGSLQAPSTIVQPTNSIGMYAPVCMPKDYIFAARQSPVYNEDVVVPGSVRDLRKAFQLLGYREKVNRFDNRIKAWMHSMFGVNISDKRLDSPYWLGGSQSMFNTQEVLGTMNNTDTVLGQLGGFGVGSVRSRQVRMRSEDHGFLFSLFYIGVLPVYGDGVSRFWYRGSLTAKSRTPFADGSLDWPLPDFARIGQQGIYMGEVSVNPAAVAGAGSDYRATGGYNDRYSDLGFSNSDVCGDFRTTLRFWHTGLFFGQSPAPSVSSDPDLSKFQGVDGNFVTYFERNLPNMRLGRTGTTRNTIATHLTSRLFDAGLTADSFWCVVNNDFFVSRRLPHHPKPGGADHTR